jgi:hypothetical protein
VYRGGLPAWTATARPPSFEPYALSLHGDVAAILFGHPFRAGHPTDPTNKILWIVRLPRDGHPLLIGAHPERAMNPTVRSSWSDNSSPGEIYPSIVDVPTAGCWRLMLRWGAHSDQIDLPYGPAQQG